jgi:hypothetical protein
VSTVSDSGGMDGLRRPVASPRGDYTQSVRGRAVHFFCKLVATVIVTGKVWKLVWHCRGAHAEDARAYRRNRCLRRSIYPLTHATCCQHLHAGAHIRGAQMSGRAAGYSASARRNRLGDSMLEGMLVAKCNSDLID